MTQTNQQIDVYQSSNNFHLGTTIAPYRTFELGEPIISNADEVNLAAQAIADKVGLKVGEYYFRTSLINREPKIVEHIVCSAIKFRGKVHCGIGCSQIIENILSFVGKPNHDETREINNNQGFITSTGRFVDRYEAYPIAKANNQIKYHIDDTIRMEKHCDKPYLMSIHLYKY